MNTIPPEANRAAEALFEQWNLRYALTVVDLDEIQVDDGQQVRDAMNIALPDQVEQYYIQMKNGAQFPPIVLRSPRVMLDGNTRKAAAERNEMTSFPAYIVEIPSGPLARSLAGSLNQMGGRRLTADEAQAVAATMIGDLKFTNEQVARHVGRSAALVGQWRQQALAKEHAQRLALTDEIDKVSGNQQAILAKVTQDEPFTQLARFVGEHKVPNAELKSVVKDVAEATSEDEALSAIEDARRRWQPVGPGAKVIVNKAAFRARMVVPQLLKLRPADVVDASDRDRALTDRAAWANLRAHVDQILQAFDVQGITTS